MNVLMIVSNDVVHDSRVLKEARTLRDAGHVVKIIGWDRTGRLPETDRWDGIEIVRVRTRGTMRILVSDVIRNPLWWHRAERLARRLSFDVIHCHDLDTLPIGVRLKRAMRKPLVYDAHEVFGYMIERDVPRPVVDYAFRLERRLAVHADRIIAVNEGVKGYVEEIARRPAVIVRNAQDRVLETYRPPPGPPFTVLYIGTLHKSRFILPAIDVVGQMQDVVLRIAGGKSLSDRVRRKCAEHPNTQFLGVVPNHQVLPMTIEAHAVLSMFEPSYRINKIGTPNKIYEAMAVGRPSIVTEGIMMAELITREDCGIAVPYTEVGFRDAITRLRDDPALAERLGRNGLRAAHREYNWRSEASKLINLYEDLREHSVALA